MVQPLEKQEAGCSASFDAMSLVCPVREISADLKVA